MLQGNTGNQGQLAILQGQLSGLRQHFSQWQAALAQLELSQAQSGNPLQIVQLARPIGSPVRPNIQLNTAGGLLAGLALGIVLVLLYERFDTRVRNPDEVTRLLQWPVLATIWRFKSSSAKDVIDPAGKNINVESYRILRTNIGFSSIGKPFRSLIVTSPLAGNGKSTIAANLAIFMARAGKSTLLIDADLRHPAQNRLFSLSSGMMGFSNAVVAFNQPEAPGLPRTHEYDAQTVIPRRQPRLIAASFSLEPFVHKVDIPNLWVMPSGPLPPNPPELLEAHDFQGFLAVILKSGIEVVIFDTPPLLGLSDASILASKVDGALVVVDMRRATKSKLRQTKVILSQTGVHVLGCVANKLRLKGSDRTYNYYAGNQPGREIATSNGHMSAGLVAPARTDQRSGGN